MTKKKLVVLSGAGVSAESGIATFRGGDGLWESHRIEDVATPQAWERDPELVNRFYNLRRKDILAAAPNEAHLLLAALEKEYDVTIITQNIDNLHERAGSTQVVHLHGEILKMRCERDITDIQDTMEDITSYDRSQQGHRMRPHIVWFGEDVPLISDASYIVEEADILLIIGTSLLVYPAAGLIRFAPSHVPVYIIDTQIPDIANNPRITTIQQAATTGMKVFCEMLQEGK